MKIPFQLAVVAYLIVLNGSISTNDACGITQDSASGSVESSPANYKTVEDIPYYDPNAPIAPTQYAAKRCRLDVYYPTDANDFPTVVWFHGGGLKSGSRSIPQSLQQKGIGVIAVDYRLHPKVKSPAYIEDAAAAVAWSLNHIDEYGGSKKKVFVSGHSAGGYLSMMVGMDPQWLAAHNINLNQVAGLIPFSGHTITHFTVRAERGIDGKQPVVDNLAPLYHVQNEISPMLLITGDREKEMLGRYEENAYLWRMMKIAGHSDTELFELEGYDHGKMVEPAFPLLIEFIRSRSTPQ